jgi:hypothetical protein
VTGIGVRLRAGRRYSCRISSSGLIAVLQTDPDPDTWIEAAAAIESITARPT